MLELWIESLSETEQQLLTMQDVWNAAVGCCIEKVKDVEQELLAEVSAKTGQDVTNGKVSILTSLQLDLHMLFSEE